MHSCWHLISHTVLEHYNTRAGKWLRASFLEVSKCPHHFLSCLCSVPPVFVPTSSSSSLTWSPTPSPSVASVASNSSYDSPRSCHLRPLSSSERQSKRFRLSIQVPDNSLTDDSLSHSQATRRHLGKPGLHK